MPIADRLRDRLPPRLLAPLLIALLLVALAPGAEAQQNRYASIVVDAETGAVLHERNADALRYPASLTKMMTLYMTFEALRDGRLHPDQRLPVSARAAGMVPSKLGVRAGQTVRVEDAIQALITRSANDVAVVVAEALAGSESRFAERMTERARRLGMSRTTFRNASGLPDGQQRSTARDMAHLSMALLRDFPEHYHRFGARQFRYGGRVHANHNRLLASYGGLDGIKTGYIRASGFNIAASAVRGGRRVIAVVFGGRTAQSRNDHAVELLDRAFARITPPRGHQVLGPPARKPSPETLLAGAPDPALGPPELKPGPVEIVPVMLSAAPIPTPLLDQGSAELGEGDPATGFGIQVGAFSDPAAAEQALAYVHGRYAGLLGAGRQHVMRIERDGATIYRARLVGLSEAQASDTCRRLLDQRMACHVITAEGPDLSVIGVAAPVTGMY